MVASLEQTVPGSEQVRLKRGFHSGRLAALQFSAYQGEPIGKPPGGVEPIQDMTASGQIGFNGDAIGVGTVGDNSLHALAPSVPLFDEKPAQRSFGASREHRKNLSGVTIDNHRHIPVALSDRGLIDQQHLTPLTAPPNLYPPGPVSNQPHDQMPPNPVTAGHRPNGHRLGVLDQPASPSAGHTSLELRMILQVSIPAAIAHEPPLGPQKHRRTAADLQVTDPVMTIIEVPQSRSSKIPTLGSVILGWLVSFRSVFSGLGLV